MGPMGRAAPLVAWLPFTLILIHGAASAAAECDQRLQTCWDLFQSAQVSLGVRDNFGIAGEASLSPTETRARCISRRTFYLCIANMSAGGGATICRGNLNFHSAQKGIERQMRQFNCSVNGSVFEPSDVIAPTFDEVCKYPGDAPHKHCGLFGDPHLRTFSDEFQTCRVAGAWPLLDNKYLTVQVTNDPVGLGGKATATSKVTIVVKRDSECASSQFVMYQARTEYNGVSLPSTFDNGHTHLGPNHSVVLREIIAGQQVELHMRVINTTVVVRLVGRYLAVAISMPEDVVKQSVEDNPDSIQLCARGCPVAEQINYKEYLASHKDSRGNHVASPVTTSDAPAMSRKVAMEKCRDVKVVDFYFDSCVFDLMTTGNRNFSQAAEHAYQDVLRLYPAAAALHHNRTDLNEIDKQYAGSSSRTRLSLVVMVIVLFATITTEA